MQDNQNSTNTPIQNPVKEKIGTFKDYNDLKSYLITLDINTARSFLMAGENEDFKKVFNIEGLYLMLLILDKNYKLDLVQMLVSRFLFMIQDSLKKEDDHYFIREIYKIPMLGLGMWKDLNDREKIKVLQIERQTFIPYPESTSETHNRNNLPKL